MKARLFAGAGGDDRRIHVLAIEKKGVDARAFASPRWLRPRWRVKLGHDESEETPS